MNDRELLELAAKAAGLNGCVAEMPNPDRLVFLVDGLDREWSPLTDDGDALRLAVKLELVIDTPDEYSGVQVMSKHLKRRFVANDGLAFVTLKKNPYEATRRAIVRCAAEIGKTL